MKQWKKYLIAAGIPLFILALVLIVQNSTGPKSKETGQSRTNANENSRKKEDIKENSMETDSSDPSATDKESSLLPTNADSADESNTVDENKSEEEIKAEIDEFISTYFNNNSNNDNKNKNSSKGKEKFQGSNKTIQDKKKNEVIEEYRNIKNYIKPGLDADSYVVFTTYDIKIFNIDTLVPGMSSLYLVRNEKGNLELKDDTDDTKLADYMKQLTEKEDIKKVINKVNSELKAAVKKDNSLKVLLDYLK
jgi:hypothetical protein